MSTLPFAGYPDPWSIYTPTPDQFLDVVLRHSCPGVGRLVGFMVRRAYGYSGPPGSPYAPQTEFTAAELQAGAGLPVRSFRRLLPAAIQAGFVEEIPGRPGFYRLRIDAAGEYHTDPDRFQGFFAGEAHRTGIPDVFFEVTLPNERIAVCRVILVFLRRRMQHRAEDGTRARPLALSLQAIAKAAGLTVGATIEALALAVAHGHLAVVDRGNSLPGQPFRPAEYAILTAAAAKRGMGQKGYGEPAKRDMESAANGGMAVAAKRGMALSKVVPTEDRLKEQQQTAAAAVASRSRTDPDPPEVTQMVAIGLDAGTAWRLWAEKPAVVTEQLGWWKERKVDRNPGGALFKAIETPWGPPEGVIRAREAARAREKPARPPIDGAAVMAALEARRQADHEAMLARPGRAQSPEFQALARFAGMENP